MTVFTTAIYSIVETITIGHAIDKISDFTVKAKNISRFESTSAVEVCDVTIKNNTRDGYKVTLKTAFGALHSSTSANGETNIPYHLVKSSSGIQPTGGTGFIPLTIAATPPTTETVILGADEALSGNALLNTPTELDFTLKIKIQNANFIEMAGTYTDTLTLTYTDL